MTEVKTAICAGLAAGKSLRKVAQEAGISHSTVLDWVESDAEFGDQYARARDIGYKLLADEIVEISDDSKGDVWIDADGNERTDQERVARSRLRVDSRKWILSKMLPKVYGEKQTHEHTGADGKPIQFQRLEVVVVDPKDKP